MALGSIAVIVAHPDDEVLAFGGLMARQSQRGHKVEVLILATGLASRTHDGTMDTNALERLRQDALRANEILGVSRLELADFPDNRMDTVALLDVVKRVETFLSTSQATTVLTHHAGDMNIDHTVTSRATLTACRTLPGSRIRRVLSGEILSSSEYTFPEHRFQPTSFADVTGHVDAKCRAMEAYAGEIRDWPHPRSTQAIRSLAQLRGSEIGVEAAEALRVLREIVA